MRWSLHRSTKPKPGEPSICGHCAAFVIFTDELTLRALDWPDWCLLTHAKKEFGGNASGDNGANSGS
jgi:hypothetical protein